MSCYCGHKHCPKCSPFTYNKCICGIDRDPDCVVCNVSQVANQRAEELAKILDEEWQTNPVGPHHEYKMFTPNGAMDEYNRCTGKTASNPVYALNWFAIQGWRLVHVTATTDKYGEETIWYLERWVDES